MLYNTEGKYKLSIAVHKGRTSAMYLMTPITKILFCDQPTNDEEKLAKKAGNTLCEAGTEIF